MAEHAGERGVVEEITGTASVGVALARARTTQAIMPLPVDAVRDAFAACQAAAVAVLTAEDFEGDGKDRFLKKSGMRKVAAVTDLDVSILTCTAERDSAGAIVAASAIARATSAAGRSMDADGYCSVDEKRFQSEKGRARLEHDLRSTATTRAKTRAIAELLGIDITQLTPGTRANVSAPASDELRDVAFKAIAWLHQGDIEAADNAIAKLHEQFGTSLPALGLQAIVVLASALRAHAAATAGAPA